MTATKDNTQHAPQNSTASGPEPGTAHGTVGTAHGTSDTASTSGSASTAETADTAATAHDAVHGAAEATAAQRIGGARGRIDALDERIIALVQERMNVSGEIQQARMSTGGRRVHLSREMTVLAHYRTELGRPGTQLAMTLLGLCRGNL